MILFAFRVNCIQQIQYHDICKVEMYFIATFGVW